MNVSQFRVQSPVLTLGEVRNGIDPLADRDAAQAKVFLEWLDDLRKTFAARIAHLQAFWTDWTDHNGTVTGRP